MLAQSGGLPTLVPGYGGTGLGLNTVALAGVAIRTSYEQNANSYYTLPDCVQATASDGHPRILAQAATLAGANVAAESASGPTVAQLAATAAGNVPPTDYQQRGVAVTLPATVTSGYGGGATPQQIDEQLSATHGAGAWGPAVGPGPIPVSITCEDTAGNPLAGVEVWVTSDAAGNNPVAGPLTTGEAGEVVFMLAAGTWWLWRQAAGLRAGRQSPGDHSLMDKFRRYRSLCQTRFDAAVEEAGQMRLTGMTLRQIAKRQKCALFHGRTPPGSRPRVVAQNAADSYETVGRPRVRELELLSRETWQQWERSKPDKRQKSATESSVPKESIATTERRTGNPAWIDKLIRIHAAFAP